MTRSVRTKEAMASENDELSIRQRYSEDAARKQLPAGASDDEILLQRYRNFIAELDKALALMSRKRAKMDRNPALKREAQVFARKLISEVEDFRNKNSKIHDKLEFLDLQSDFSRLIDEAREFID